MIGDLSRVKEHLSIKEFAYLSRIEQTTLRYWDDIGLFSPSKRDPDNNYRYYSPEQIIAVKFTAVLSDLNVPLKEIASIKQDRNPEKIIELISSKERQLGLELLRIQQQFSILHTRRRLIEEGIRAVRDHDLTFSEEEKRSERPCKVALQLMEEEEIAYVMGPRSNFKENGEFYESFVNFCTKADELRIKLSLPIAGRHDSFESFKSMPGGPDNFISVDPAGSKVSPAGKYLAGYVRGYYGQLANIDERMLEYMQEHKLKPVGPVYTEYLHDEICLADPIDYLARVSVRVEEA